MTRAVRTAAALALALLLSACGEDEVAEAPMPARPVRTVTVGPPDAAPVASFTGRIEAKDQVPLAFRLSGRLSQRLVNVGDRVEAGQPIARLDPVNELNALRSARAALTGAESRLVQAENQLERQRHLNTRGITSAADLEAAEQGATAARAAVDATRAQLATAEEFVRFTEIDADAPGVVTGVGAEPGEVVGAGQMVVELARRDGRDAVFDVPEQALRDAAGERAITVTLADGGTGSAAGRVREVSPQADPVTRTFTVRVGLVDPPPTFRLGATVTGRVEGDAVPHVSIPASAIARAEGGTAVFIVDPATQKVSRRAVELARIDPGTASVSKGLEPGDIVVTAGVGSLSDGQAVRLPGAEL